MHFTTRESNILLLLQEGNIDIDALADKFTVSTKTIKNDITSINSKISSFDSELKINKTTVIFDSIYPSVHWKNIVKLNMSIEEEDLIFLKLLLKTEYVAMSDFAAELYISKSKLEKMLATSPHLDQYVSKKRNVGIKIELELEDKISLAIACLLPYVDDLNYLVTSRALIQQVNDTEITIGEFKRYIDKFYQIVDSNSNITDKECKILILLVLIVKHILKFDDSQIDNLVPDFVSNDTDLKLTTVIEQNVREILSQNSIVNYEGKIFNNLVLHIENAINTKYTNTIVNELELRIKTQYSYAYNIASEIYNRLVKTLSIELADYEKNYIAMYIQTIFNSREQNHSLQVLIVCQYGLSVSNYIQAWIEQNIDLDITFTVSSVLNFWNLKETATSYDVVITTIDNLEVDNKNLVRLAAVPTTDEFNYIKSKIINCHFQKQMDSFISSNSLHQISIESIDQMYGIIEEDFHHANHQFLEAMKVRTNEGLSNINGVIIMHSDGSLITDNRLLIYKLENPISYNDSEVRMIFVFAFSIEFIERFNNVIKQLYRIIYSKEYVNALYETATDKQFMWILSNQIKSGSNTIS